MQKSLIINEYHCTLHILVCGTCNILILFINLTFYFKVLTEKQCSKHGFNKQVFYFMSH